MSDNLSEAKVIITSLYNEFLEEEKKINEICDSHSVRIDELEHRISNYKKNDDVDFKVFSPRNRSTVNSDKISEMEEEKSGLERELEFSSKQLKYYSDKVSKLERVLSLLNIGVAKRDVFGDIDDSSAFEESVDTIDESDFDNLFVSEKDIDFLDNPDNEEKESGENIDQVVSNINSLFRNRILADLLVDSSDNKSEDDKSINDSDQVDSDIVNDSVDSSVSNLSISDANDNGDANIISESSLLSINNNPAISEGISKGEIAHIIHKAEFTSKIISNDSHRAKIELSEIIKLLKKLIN